MPLDGGGGRWWLSESIGKGLYTHARIPLESLVRGVCVLTVHNLHFEDSSWVDSDMSLCLHWLRAPALCFRFLPVSVCTHSMLAIMSSSPPIADENTGPEKGAAFPTSQASWSEQS